METNEHLPPPLSHEWDAELENPDMWSALSVFDGTSELLLGSMMPSLVSPMATAPAANRMRPFETEPAARVWDPAAVPHSAEAPEVLLPAYVPMSAPASPSLQVLPLPPPPPQAVADLPPPPPPPAVAAEPPASTERPAAAARGRKRGRQQKQRSPSATAEQSARLRSPSAGDSVESELSKRLQNRIAQQKHRARKRQEVDTLRGMLASKCAELEVARSRIEVLEGRLAQLPGNNSSSSIDSNINNNGNNSSNSSSIIGSTSSSSIIGSTSSSNSGDDSSGTGPGAPSPPLQFAATATFGTELTPLHPDTPASAVAIAAEMRVFNDAYARYCATAESLRPALSAVDSMQRSSGVGGGAKRNRAKTRAASGGGGRGPDALASLQDLVARCVDTTFEVCSFGGQTTVQDVARPRTGWEVDCVPPTHFSIPREHLRAKWAAFVDSPEFGLTVEQRAAIIALRDSVIQRIAPIVAERAVKVRAVKEALGEISPDTPIVGLTSSNSTDFGSVIRVLRALSANINAERNVRFEFYRAMVKLLKPTQMARVYLTALPDIPSMMPIANIVARSGVVVKK
jgi:hypothetical protein